MTPAKLGKSLQEGLADLLQELDLARRMERPSIILAECASKLIRARVEDALAESLKPSGQAYVPVQFDPASPDPAQTLLRNARASDAVFSISGLGQGGGPDGKDSYRALNLHREAWVENRIRAIFWLTSEEAADLARNAPDFWAFRHRVLIFDRSRGQKLANLPSGFLLWESRATESSIEEIESSIQYREGLLQQIPSSAESLSTRVDLQLLLSRLFWAKGDLVNAINITETALDSLKEHGAAEHGAPLLNCKGILQNETNGPASAMGFFQQASEAEKQNSIYYSNLGAASFAVGRAHDANTLFERATRIDPNNPGIWAVWGFVALSAGKYDDAKRTFETASRIDPKNDDYFLALTACHYKMKDSRGLEEMFRSSRLPATRDTINSACLRFLRGDSAGAQTSLLHAARSDSLTRLQAARSPLVHALFGPLVLM